MSEAIDVDFANGEELLTSYWGYLTGGGLIIADPGVEVGEAIALQVTIESSSTKLRLEGTVVKREPDTQKTIIAFRQGEAHDKLLSEAMAESENVAPRRYARFSINRSVKTKAGDRECEVNLVNLSLEGCCLLLSEAGEGFDVGEEVILMHGDTHAVGSVVWSRELERGLRMSSDESRPLLKELCPDLVLAPG
jgi:hypothetical protein